MKDTRVIIVLLILLIATLCPAEATQIVTIGSTDYTLVDTVKEGYFYVSLSDSSSDLNFDIKFEGHLIGDSIIMDEKGYIEFYYCLTNDNPNDYSTLKNCNYIKIVSKKTK